MDLRIAQCKTRAQRFWSYVEIKEGNRCWNWTRSMRGGYGQFNISSKGTGKKLGSHQVAAIFRLLFDTVVIIQSVVIRLTFGLVRS